MADDHDAAPAEVDPTGRWSSKRRRYEEIRKATDAHGRELIQRYGLDKHRPVVKVGHAHKKTRR